MSRPQRRPGRLPAAVVYLLVALYLCLIAMGTGICIAMAWKAGLP